jgi:hypothetical protein
MIWSYEKGPSVKYRWGPLVETGGDYYSIRERLNLKHMAENESRSSKRGKMRDFQPEEDFEYEEKESLQDASPTFYRDK